MKFLILTAYYPPHQIGGHEIRCKEVVDSLSLRGHQAQILTTRCPIRNCKDHQDESAVFRILHQRNGTGIFRQVIHDIRDMICINHKVNSFKPDIIYLWGIQNMSNAILPYFSRKNIKIVFDEGGAGLIHLYRIFNRGLYFYHNENDPIIKKFFKWFFYFFVRVASLGLIQSRWNWPKDMQVYFNSFSALKNSQGCGVPLENAKVIISGIDKSKYPYEARDGIRSPVTIIVPGRIKPQKGTLDSIQLLKELRNRNINTNLIIIGYIQDVDYFSKINKLIEENELCGWVNFLPMIPSSDLANLYRETDICFFPSYFKSGLSRVPLEAMSSGCVVLTYGNEGSNEIVQDQKTGFIISEGDYFGVADCIEHLINHPQIYQDVAGYARAKINNDHNLDIYIDSIEKLLYEVQKN